MTGQVPSPACILVVRVTPKSRSTDVRITDGVVRVAAAPKGGRATETARRALASALRLHRTAVELEAGATSRTKRFRVDGLNEATARQRLAG